MRQNSQREAGVTVPARSDSNHCFFLSLEQSKAVFLFFFIFQKQHEHAAEIIKLRLLQFGTQMGLQDFIHVNKSL